MHNFAGDGIEYINLDDMIKKSLELAISWERESSIQKLIQQTSFKLEFHKGDAFYVV